MTDVVLAVENARDLTDRIRKCGVVMWDLVIQAYTGRAWVALGYASWDEYCKEEFQTLQLRLPREERSGVVTSLREAGFSLRAIAEATGVSKDTVQRELSGVSNETPDLDEDALAEALIAAAPPSIRGRDGRPYPSFRPRPQLTPEAEEARKRREEEDRERQFRSELYSGIAAALSTVGGYGGYEDIAKLMRNYNPDELDPPMLDRYLELDNLQSAQRFIGALIEWRKSYVR